MRIHLDQIKETGLQLSYVEPAESFSVLLELIQDEEVAFTKPIEAQLECVRISKLVKVDGDFKTAVRLTCDRCLNDFETGLQNTFTLTYTPDTSNASEEDEEEQELTIEDMGLIPFRGEEIDLRPGVQEQIVLALPVRAVCSKECKGLCSQRSESTGRHYFRATALVFVQIRPALRAESFALFTADSPNR